MYKLWKHFSTPRWKWVYLCPICLNVRAFIFTRLNPDDIAEWDGTFFCVCMSISFKKKISNMKSNAENERPNFIQFETYFVTIHGFSGLWCIILTLYMYRSINVHVHGLHTVYKALHAGFIGNVTFIDTFSKLHTKHAHGYYIQYICGNI